MSVERPPAVAARTSRPNLRAARLEATVLEVDLRTDLHEPGREHRQRRQPGAVRNKRLIVGQHRGRVEDVEDVEADVEACAPKLENLADPEVDLVHAVAPDV